MNWAVSRSDDCSFMQPYFIVGIVSCKFTWCYVFTISRSDIFILIVMI